MSVSDVPIVTIDGPAASGKTSVSRELAKKMGWQWVSTGAFYRGLAYVAQQMGVDLTDEKALEELCQSPIWQVKMAPDRTQVLFKGLIVTDAIYKEEVGSAASQISHYPGVRSNLLSAQRQCAVNVPGLVAEGRDCGTVVFPQANVKIYLTARSESRAERRALEQGANVQETQAAQSRRDAQDAGRKTAPLQIPDHAFVLDTSEMSLEEVVHQVEDIVRQKISR